MKLIYIKNSLCISGWHNQAYAHHRSCSSDDSYFYRVSALNAFMVDIRLLMSSLSIDRSNLSMIRSRLDV